MAIKRSIALLCVFEPKSCHPILCPKMGANPPYAPRWVPPHLMFQNGCHPILCPNMSVTQSYAPTWVPTHLMPQDGCHPILCPKMGVTQSYAPRGVPPLLMPQDGMPPIFGHKVLYHNILCHRVQFFCWNCFKILILATIISLFQVI